MKCKYMDVRLRLKEASEDGVFEGYASVFDDLDAYSEKVAKGAFKDSLAEHKANGTMPKLLYQHNSDWPIGVWREMAEDSKGLKVTGELNLDVQMGKEAHSLLRQGALDGLSIGFVPVKTEVDEEEGIRTLTEIDLWETSIVTFPALDSARISAVKHFSAGERPAPKIVEKALREALCIPDEWARGFMARGYKGLCDEREAPNEIATKLENILLGIRRQIGSRAHG